MGYTPTGTTETLEVYLTDAGRRDLVNGKGFIVKYFALGDTDLDYLAVSSDNMRTTDLRGSTENCFNVTARITLKDFICRDNNCP